MSKPTKSGPAPIIPEGAALTPSAEDATLMEETGATIADFSGDPDNEIVEIDKSKPADFDDDDDDGENADDVAAAIAEGQYGDDDIMEIEGDMLSADAEAQAEAAAAADAEADAEDAEAEAAAAEGAAVPDSAIAVYSGHSDAVYCVAVSPADSSLVASGAGDDSAHLVDYSDPSAPQSLLELSGNDSVSAVAFSPDGSLLAIGFMDGAIHIVDVAAREVLHELSADADLECLAWVPPAPGAAPDAAAPVLVTGNSEGLIHVWDAMGGYPRTVLTSPRREPVLALGFPRAVAAQPALLLSGGESGASTLWDLDRGRPLAQLKGGLEAHKGGVLCFARHPSQPIAVSSAQDGTVHVISLATAGKASVVNRLKDAHRDSVEVATLGQAGPQTLLATASSDCTVKIWDATRGWALRQTLQHEGGVVAALWVPNAPVLVTASADGAVRVWDARDGRLLSTLTGHNNAILAMAPAPMADGGFRVVTASDDSTVRVFDLTDTVRAARTAVAPAAIRTGK